MTSANTLNRVERACTQLHHDGQPVTSTAIAATSGTLTGFTDKIATLRTALETIATRVRRHEEQLRRLTDQKD